MLAAGARTAGEVARRTLADVYDRVGFVPRTSSVGSSGAHHRCLRRRPRALGERAPAVPHRRRRRVRAAHPDPHHAAAAARGGRRRHGRPDRRAPGRGGVGDGAVPGAPARHRHLPAGLAGRLRRRGRGDQPVRAAGAGVRQGPLVIERTFPYHPHVTVAHHLPEAGSSRRSPSSRTSTRRSTCTRCGCTSTTSIGWQPTQAFPLGELTGTGRATDGVSGTPA